MTEIKRKRIDRETCILKTSFDRFAERWNK